MKQDITDINYLWCKYDPGRKKGTIVVRCPKHDDMTFIGGKGFGLHYSKYHSCILVEPIVFKKDNKNLVLEEVDNIIFEEDKEDDREGNDRKEDGRRDD